MVDESIKIDLTTNENDERKIFEKFNIKDISPLTCKLLDLTIID